MVRPATDVNCIGRYQSAAEVTFLWARFFTDAAIRRGRITGHKVRGDLGGLTPVPIDAAHKHLALAENCPRLLIDREFAGVNTRCEVSRE